MKKIILLLLITITGNNAFAGGVVEVVRDFKVHNYACYTDSVGALGGAVEMITSKANAWCEGLDGNLSSLGNNNLEVIIHDHSPYRGGCPGDVTIKATYSCWTRANIGAYIK